MFKILGAVGKLGHASEFYLRVVVGYFFNKVLINWLFFYIFVELRKCSHVSYKEGRFLSSKNLNRHGVIILLSKTIQRPVFHINMKE